MRTIRDIDVLGDGAFRERMLGWSGALFLATVVLVVTLLAVGRPGLLRALASLGFGIVGCLVVLPVHELLHAAAFKVLGGRGCRISFGYENGCLYTRTDDLVLSRGRFVAVLLAPSVALTAVLVGLGVATGWPVAGVLAAGLHLTGCTGDLAMAWEIVTTSGVTHVQDTETGCRLLAADSR